MRNLVIILTLVSIVCACERSKSFNGSGIITFDLKELPEFSDLKLTDLGVVDVSYIPLETRENSLFSCTNNITASGKVIAGDGFF